MERPEQRHEGRAASNAKGGSRPDELVAVLVPFPRRKAFHAFLDDARTRG